RSGLPLANLASGRRLKVRLRSSAPACQLLARVGFCDIGSIFLFFMRKKKFGNEGGFFYFD
ncbi:hypothetical protein, partial [Serratia sp. CY35562]|uniref:hypothetical protein n=1 Tax=Serratia sp. CY35562 TaxID=3383606 RepID=UPI003F9F2528